MFTWSCSYFGGFPLYVSKASFITKIEILSRQLKDEFGISSETEQFGWTIKSAHLVPGQIMV